MNRRHRRAWGFLQDFMGIEDPDNPPNMKRPPAITETNDEDLNRVRRELGTVDKTWERRRR